MDDQDSLLIKTELEVQNLELRSSRQVLEETLDLYTCLYDYAAVTCITLDFRGFIREINLTGASLLGRCRDQLTGMPFPCFITPESLPEFYSHLKRCEASDSRVISRLILSIKGRDPLAIFLISAHRNDELLADGTSSVRGASGIRSLPVGMTHQSAIIELAALT